MRLYKLCLVIAVAAFMLLVSQYFIEVVLEDDTEERLVQRTQYYYSQLFKEVTDPVVVWWAPLGGQQLQGTLKQCGEHSCYFTTDHHLRHHPLTKALIFYGTMIEWTKLPLPREGPRLIWALLHEESPRNNAPLSHLPVLSLFNYTATFSRHSSLPLTTQYLGDLALLTDLKYFVPTEEKSRLQRVEGLAPVMYLQSDCSTTNDRDSYVVELVKHIQIDSYGACLHNKDLPQHLQFPHSLDTMMSDDLLHLVAKYKFVLALENGICHDYITEKLWRPLISGTVAVYIGSPTVSDWLPNNKSAVLGMDFATPEQLAKYLHLLNSDDEKYESYLNHKLQKEVTNSQLIQAVKEREWGTEWSKGQKKPDFIDSFSCYVCQKVHNPEGVSVATKDHYSCPMPESVLSRSVNRSNHWLDSWFNGKCQADVIRQFVDSGVTYFSQQEYQNALKRLILDGKCYYSEQNVAM